MKSIILFLLIGVSIFADSKVTIVPYIGFGSYDSDISDSDNLVGLYSIIKDADHSIELSIESKNLDYNDKSKLNQINLAGSYKKFLDKTTKFNTLLHYISNNGTSDKTFIALVGADKKYQNKLVLGLQVAYSIYNSDTLTKEIIQIKPSLKFNYGRADSKWGIIRPKISFYYIEPISQNATLESSYFSTELGLTHAKGSFISSISIWFGEQLYAVRDNGFTIYNLNELHTKGFILSSRYRVDNDLGVKLSYSSEDYKTYDSSHTLGDEDETINRLLLVADFTF